ncbi:shikimate kinase AroL [Desulfobaculum bizertense]|uniref:Shikimate kinase n=1 Tax=Desulfobaculum bizertense DSM 18034 TaxID=1121442 RepID=A0A1T4VXH8_9BACT|nr:shikimate kinase AroL [Desulfobaculum bizertense]UIJ36935.1 shikimate kinase AroL [Desulfobaculum bizertense]SKA69706.1 shikimate kinase [Desulfobaculum bizertense DSM 18034]
MRKIVPQNPLNKKIAVEDESRSVAFGKAPAPVPYTSETNIYLVGMRASGKTTLGKLLAQKLSRPFLDTDDVFVEQHGQSIADFVAANGWGAFRDAEAEILRSVSKSKGQVISTGGGMVLRQENRELMHRSGPVFYLYAEVPVLVQRLQADPLQDQRPSLAHSSLEDDLRAAFAERESLYLGVAHFVLPAVESLQDTLADALDKLQLLARVRK